MKIADLEYHLERKEALEESMIKRYEESLAYLKAVEEKKLAAV